MGSLNGMSFILRSPVALLTARYYEQSTTDDAMDRC